MGVTGLWRLIEPAGKPVPVETLENKVLAVDISIWLHQMVKGYQDAKGAPLPNAHLMGLFQRLCKLLYFRIKPVFVFDGGFPDLKRETIAKRQDNKSKYHSESERLKREIALILSKKTAVGSLLGKQYSPKKANNVPTNDDDLFKLPELPQREEEIDSESDDEQNSSGSIVDLHSVDIESDKFKTLPVKDKYEVLLELKETRKMNSWGRLHELPKKSDNFSDFQMQRLLKRRKVQECLQETEKEMGDSGMSFNDLESLLNEEGIDTKIESLATRRIASNNTTRFLLINDVKRALADAKKKEEKANDPGPSNVDPVLVDSLNPQDNDGSNDIKIAKKDELEDDLEKAIQMSLECVNEGETSVCTSKTDDSWTSFVTDSEKTDSEEEDGFQQPDDLSSAKAYIMQYSDFTSKAIEEITSKRRTKKKSTVPKVDDIIEELSKEKSFIVDNVDLSSSDDGFIAESSDSNNLINKVQSYIELNSTSEDFDSPMNIDATQSSVVYIENKPDIITLDSSVEVESKSSATITQLILDKKTCSISDSSEEEFEEVSDDPDAEVISRKPVIEFTVNIGSAPEDDIFADVFIDKNKELAITGTVDSILGSIEFKDNKFYMVNETENKKPIDLEQTHETQEDNRNTEIKVTEIAANQKQEVTRKSDVVSKNVGNKNTIDEKEVVKTKENSGTNDIPSIQDNQVIIINNTKVCNKESDKYVAFANKDNSNEKTETVVETEIHKEKPRQVPRDPITTEKLNSMVEELQNEEQDLIQEKGRLDRIGRNITEQMTKEAQELLQLFGIPYVIAPMEAEAQCAFLETVKLTDGTITDDSDIWLFGGRTVYKNFFNQKKHVLQFLAERIERSFNLTREQLVLLALLVGSDYTTGVTGVGPVTALEILASFPFNKRQFLNETSKQAQYTKIVTGLQEFKKWVRAGKRTDNTTLKKKLRNVNLTDDFPSVRVVQAYLEPNVEKSEEKFSWGDLDITLLRDYTKAKFGWSQSKLDEIIKPVLKRMSEGKTQRSVQDYFKRKVDFQPLDEHMSKRVKAAVQRMGPELPLHMQGVPLDDVPVEQIKSVRKRKTKKTDDETQKGVAGPSNAKMMKNSEKKVLLEQGVRVMSQIQEEKTTLEINIPKTDRFQEIIPQREKEKQSLLQNKMKAIEVFRKTTLDRKKKRTKRKVNLPKEKAELSESSDSN